MDSQILTYLIAGAGAAGAAAAIARARRRLQLSGAKHPSLAGHARISSRIAKLIPFYEFGEDRFFCSDGAPPEIAKRRQMAFEALARDYEHRFANTIALKAEIKDAISDLQFTDAYRVPYQYSRLVRERLGGGPLLQSSHGVMLTDVDGNQFYDLAGSYGVNLFGYDFYKGCIERGVARVGALGPGARRSASGGCLQRQAPARDLRPRRGLLPHVRHRGGHAGRAPRPLPHGPPAHRALLRRLSRLVGRRAAGRRQSRARRRDLHARRHVREIAARARDPPRHRLRARQSLAGHASQRAGARGFRAHRQLAPRRLRSRGLRGVAGAPARGVHPARHRPHLRRDLRRLPSRPGRRAGVLRRARRPRDLRQEPRRRPPRRRRLRPPPLHEALP